jgi:hypothetical protein
MLLHFRHVRPSMAFAGKCSCISGMSGRPWRSPENAPAFPACPPSMAAKNKAREAGFVMTQGTRRTLSP